MKPVIGITLGCPCGVGPEIVAKAVADPRVLDICETRVFGMLPGRSGSCAAVPFMGPKECGSISMAAVDDAVRAVMQGEVSAIVTAPINKAHWKAAGSPFMGHTEYLAHVSGAGPFAMMMASPKLKVSLVTTHIPLADVPKTITIERICEVVRLTYRFVNSEGSEPVAQIGYRICHPRESGDPEHLNTDSRFRGNDRLCATGSSGTDFTNSRISEFPNFEFPKIAVCSLNPHAGEAGAIGKEEETVIIQAVKLLQQEGLPVSGPYPADTVFHRAVKGEFAAVVAMYHDQGLAPIKTLDFARTVNVTLGLPFVRTSPDHGTAEDIAGKRIASHENMVEAIKLAVTLCHSREACPSPD